VQETAVAAPDAVVEEVDRDKESVVQLEPGADYIFVSLPNGGHDPRRIHFKYVKKLQDLNYIFTFSVL
jgi:hypothetical protein